MKTVLGIIIITIIAFFGCKQTDNTTSNNRKEKEKDKNKEDKKEKEIFPFDSKTISILDIGGIGNGQFDNSAVFEKAVNQLGELGGGVLNIPKGHFIITRPILLKDNVTIQGEGEASIIENISEDNILSTIIFPGVHHPLKNDDYSYVKAESIKAKSSTVTLKSTSHDFKIGDIVFIQSSVYEIGKGARGTEASREVEAVKEYKLPEYFIGNKITNIKGLVLTFENIFEKNIQSPKLTKATGIQITKGYSTYSCQNAQVRDLKLKSKGKAFRFALAYRCKFENLTIDAETPIFGNAYQYCEFKTIEANFSNRFIELKNGSHNTIVSNCTGRYVPRKLLDGKDKNGNVISIGEKAFGIEISNCNINAGTYDLSNSFIHLNANECIISNNKLSFSGETIKTVLFISGNNSQGNRFTNNEIHAEGKFNNFVRIGNAQCKEVGAKGPSDNYIGQNQFLGKPQRGIIMEECGVNNIIEGNLEKEKK